MTSDALVSRREDELAIRELANRYARMVDRRDWSEIPRVFTPDCVLSGVGFRMQGHAEHAAGLRKIDMFSATQHCVLNQVTRFEAEGTTGEFYCVAYHIHERDGVPYKLDMGIRYDDRYVRTPEGWRLGQRTLNLIWQQDLPLDLSVAAFAPAKARAGRASGTGVGAGRRKRSAAKSKPGPKATAKRAGTRKAVPKKGASRKAAKKKRGRG